MIFSCLLAFLLRFPFNHHSVHSFIYFNATFLSTFYIHIVLWVDNIKESRISNLAGIIPTKSHISQYKATAFVQGTFYALYMFYVVVFYKLDLYLG